MSEFDIGFLFTVDELVKRIEVYSKELQSSDERGEERSPTLLGSDVCIVISADANTTWLDRGIQIDHDYDLYFKEDSSVASYLQEGNLIKLDSRYYNIVKSTHNPGHYEVLISEYADSI